MAQRRWGIKGEHRPAEGTGHHHADALANDGLAQRDAWPAPHREQEHEDPPALLAERLLEDWHKAEAIKAANSNDAQAIRRSSTWSVGSDGAAQRLGSWRPTSRREARLW